MRKKKVLIPLVTTMVMAVFLPVTSYANQVSNVSNQIQQIKKQAADKKTSVNAIKNQIDAVKQQQQNTKDDIMSLDLKMNDTQAKIDDLNGQIKSESVKARQAAKDLQAAMDRVAKRDGLLKSRVNAMYEGGNISYLDVLMGSQGISDFLSRLDAVQSIVDQDVQILQDNKHDRDTIQQKKQQIETNLSNLKKFETNAQQLVATLTEQKKERQKILADLQKKEGALEEAKAAQEQAALDLVNQLQQKIDAQRQAEAQAAQAGGGSYTPPVQYTGGRFAVPVPGAVISSPFGWREHPILHTRKFHDGVDFAAPEGTTIEAAADGVVATAGYISGYGNAVVIYHGNGISTLYGHIRNGGIKVSEGQSVKAGQKIAEVGSTGMSTGPHCHFSVIVNGQKVDPMSYLR
jgi:murein DD-endopeptidase MepM/ murein hydrolase activator NlpD